MADAVSSRLRASGLAGRTVTVKLRYGDFTTITRSHSLHRPVASSAELVKIAAALLVRGRGPSRRAPARRERLFARGASRRDRGAARASGTSQGPPTARRTGPRLPVRTWTQPSTRSGSATASRRWALPPWSALLGCGSSSSVTPSGARRSDGLAGGMESDRSGSVVLEGGWDRPGPRARAVVGSLPVWDD